MPIEFTQYAQPTGSSDNSLFRLSMAYDESGYIPNVKFEWYLKNHLGSTMLVYGTQSVSQVGMADFGIEKAAYDYRAFGEQMSIVEPADKVTETFTGKELDDEIALNYFGARYLDPMLGLWISVDAARQYPNPYLYAGNNPVMRTDPDGNYDAQSIAIAVQKQVAAMSFDKFVTKPAEKVNEKAWAGTLKTMEVEAKGAKYSLDAMSVVYPIAKPAVMILDAVEGYAENGWEGAGTAFAVDMFLGAAGKALPKNIVSEAAQTVAGEVIGNKVQADLKDAIMMRGVDRSSERDIIEFPECSSDNTSVK